MRIDPACTVVAALSLTVASTIAAASDTVDRPPISLLPELQEALGRTPEYLVPGRKPPDAATVAASMHYLSVILAAWNPGFRRDQVLSVLAADLSERGIAAGLLAPALYVIEESLLLGIPEYAQVTSPVVAALSPPLQPFLRRNKLPLTFSKAISKSPNRLVAITDFLAGVAQPGRSKEMPGTAIQRLLRGGSSGRPDYAMISMILVGWGSLRDRAVSQHQMTRTDPSPGQRGIVTGQSFSVRENGCLALCALGALPQWGWEVGKASLGAVITGGTFYTTDPTMLVHGIAAAVAKGGVETALDAGTCAESCLAAEKERQARAEAERKDLEKKDTELKKREEENREQLSKVQEEKKKAETEDLKAAADLKEQELKEKQKELDEERRKLDEERKKGGRYGPDGGPPPRTANGPRPPIDPHARGGYQLSIADGVALWRVAAMKTAMSAAQLRAIIEAETTRARDTLGVRKP